MRRCSELSSAHVMDCHLRGVDFLRQILSLPAYYQPDIES